MGTITKLPRVVGVRTYRGKHLRRCQCWGCLKKRADAFEARVHEMETARPPGLGETVPIRAHWRCQPNHLKNDPGLRALVEKIVRSELARIKKEARR